MPSRFQKFFPYPLVEYVAAGVLIAILLLDWLLLPLPMTLLVISIAGSLPTLIKSLEGVRERKITIEIFNVFALGVSFATGEIRSAAFIVLMLAFARLLEWKTQAGVKNAIEELLKLRPLTATIETPEGIRDVAIDQIKKGDIVIVKTGGRVPVDGRIVFGSAYFNEAPVTGESRLIEHVVGDLIISSTLNESGTIKMSAEFVGKDSTIERMVALMREASKNKSRSERVADRFAGLFLPLVVIAGIATYFITRDIKMMAALFLVSCADDIAVAIPLAMSAALGRAAKRGVVIKGGEWLDVLSRVKILVLDKTGTLTYGEMHIAASQAEGISESSFWRAIAVAEKFSEHPIGRAVFREAAKRFQSVPDPEHFEIFKGSGLRAKYEGIDIVVGNEGVIDAARLRIAQKKRNELLDIKARENGTVFYVFIDKKYAGFVTVADTPRIEARQTLAELRSIGIKRIIMFTGDNEAVANRIAGALGIDEVRFDMKPEEKLRQLEELLSQGPVGMVGDGINDAPSLARADVAVAIGQGASGVASEAADVVILSGDLSHLPEMILLGRKTMKTVRGDIWLWAGSNALGFALVFMGILGPALAAFYNFFTDFLPLLNSAKLFKIKKTSKIETK